MKIEIDAREFNRTLKQYADLSKKDHKEIVRDRASKLTWALYKAFRAVAPSIAEIRALPKRLGNRIKRRFEGQTIKQEIGRRIRARFAAAAGWLIPLRRLTKKAALSKKRPGGQVIINLKEPSITIINDLKEGIAADKKYILMQSAIDAQTADMIPYINRKLEERAKQFSAK